MAIYNMLRQYQENIKKKLRLLFCKLLLMR